MPHIAMQLSQLAQSIDASKRPPAGGEAAAGRCEGPAAVAAWAYFTVSSVRSPAFTVNGVSLSGLSVVKPVTST